MSKKLSATGIYDVDQKILTHVFDGGTAKEQKEAAEAQVARMDEHIGEGQPRDLRIVNVQEV